MSLPELPAGAGSDLAALVSDNPLLVGGTLALLLIPLGINAILGGGGSGKAISVTSAARALEALEQNTNVREGGCRREGGWARGALLSGRLGGATAVWSRPPRCTSSRICVSGAMLWSYPRRGWHEAAWASHAASPHLPARAAGSHRQAHPVRSSFCFSG